MSAHSKVVSSCGIDNQEYTGPLLPQSTLGETPPQPQLALYTAEPKKSKKSRKTKENSDATFDAFVDLLEKDKGAARRMFEDSAALHTVIDDMRCVYAPILAHISSEVP